MNPIARLLGAGALLWLSVAAAAPPVPTIAAETLMARQAAHDATLAVLDVRTPAEFAAGHVPGAINVPHDQVEARLGELAALEDKDVVVYCKAGTRSAIALAVLGEHGYKHLYHLDGDMPGWSAAGRPVETLPAAAAPEPSR